MADEPLSTSATFHPERHSVHAEAIAGHCFAQLTRTPFSDRSDYRLCCSLQGHWVEQIEDLMTPEVVRMEPAPRIMPGYHCLECYFKRPPIPGKILLTSSISRFGWAAIATHSTFFMSFH